MESDDRGHGSRHRTHADLKPLKSKEDVKRFLNAIRTDFLSTVNSKESGLEDILVQNGVLNCDSDVESLRHYPTRKDESRRLWTILCSVDHKIFISSALPVLCDKYYHIIPNKFWKGQSQPNGRDSITSQTQGTASEHSNENTCIRCAAKRRVREKAMLDLLYGCELMSFDEYSIYTREPLKLNWDLIFTTVHKIHPGKVKRFCGKFQKLLKDYALSVPENLEDSIKDGFPCTCFSQPEVSRRGGERCPVDNRRRPLAILCWSQVRQTRIR
ncbi:uncharacterized protein LOC112568888 [Pomacea canaliculata]|uniref:uncharacterized protein LOC112568888 n=1 Tax=Pomacea canaliculata TaxID=400727 RepID=UPI000D73DEBF|nr:uncharacterized protein LOC112568888 [Pomacea canaliculata]